MKAIIETLLDLGQDLTGNTPEAKSDRNDLDERLSAIYKQWEHDIAMRRVSDQELLYLMSRSRMQETFRDQQSKFYAVIPKPGYAPDEEIKWRESQKKQEILSNLTDLGKHVTTIDMDSEDFDRFLLELFYDKEKRVLSKDKRGLAVDMLKSYTKTRKHVYNRLAFVEDQIIYDLHEEWWRVVVISKEGWKIVRNPLLFKRPINDPIVYGQVLPDRNYDKNRKYIRELIDKSTIAYDYQKLIDEVFTVSLFIPHIAHPMLVPYGPKGSGKSTHEAIKKLLVDPYLTPEGPKLEGLVQRMPKDPKDRRVDIYDAYMVMYDNASWLAPEEMDELCTWVTGHAESVRVLHTTDERRSYAGKRILGINGINIPVSNSDILDRSLILELESLQGEGDSEEGSGTGQQQVVHHIIRETVILQQIRQEMPQILGYLFDLLSRVLRRYEKEHKTIKPNHRLADFVVWGEIISRELGYPPMEFLKAWKLNAETQSLTVIRNNSFASLFVRYAFNVMPEKEFTLTPGELFTALRKYAEDIGLDWYKDRSLPYNEVWVTRRLNEIVADLKIAGLYVNNTKGTERSIRVVKDAKAYSNYQEKQEARVKGITTLNDPAKQQEARDKRKQMVLNTFEKYLNDHDTTMVDRGVFKVYLGNFSVDAGESESLLEELIRDGKIMKDDYGALSRGMK